MASHMSSGAIGGLCLGLLLIIAFIIILIFLCTRFRSYWYRRRHSKMSNHLGEHPEPEAYVPNAATAECWTNYPYGVAAAYWSYPYPPQYDAALGNATAKTFGTPYPPAFNPSNEPAVLATHASPLQQAPRMEERAQGAAQTGAYHLGDLSTANAPAFHMYPQLVEQLTRQSEERTASTTDSSGNQSSMGTEKTTTRQKLRSKVRKVARTSQFARFPSRRMSRKDGSKKFRSKRKSRFGLEEDFSGNPSTLTEENLNSRGRNYTTNADDFGSLDNDAFLNSLESAAFPSIETPNLPRSSDHTPVGQVRFLSTVQYAPDQGHLNPSYSDVNRANRQSLSQPNQFHRPYTTFRFPAPGPPVSGWAHHFAQAAPSHTPTSKSQQQQPHTQPAKKLSAKSDSVPLLLTPPSMGESDMSSRINCSVESSLHAVTRRSNSRSPAAARLRSEPRKLSRDSPDLNRSIFEYREY